MCARVAFGQPLGADSGEKGREGLKIRGARNKPKGIILPLLLYRRLVLTPAPRPPRPSSRLASSSGKKKLFYFSSPTPRLDFFIRGKRFSRLIAPSLLSSRLSVFQSLTFSASILLSAEFVRVCLAFLVTKRYVFTLMRWQDLYFWQRTVLV